MSNTCTEESKQGDRNQEEQRWEKEEKEEWKTGQSKEQTETGFPTEGSNSLACAREEKPEADEIEQLPTWKRNFILSMRAFPFVTNACKKANCSSKTAYAHRESDKLFRDLWDEALTYSNDKLEGTAWTRAVDGMEKEMIGRDGQVIITKEFSDKLLETLLKGNLPQKYRENSAPQVTVNVLNWSNGGAELPQPVEDKMEVIEMSSEDCELLGDE